MDPILISYLHHELQEAVTVCGGQCVSKSKVNLILTAGRLVVNLQTVNIRKYFNVNIVSTPT